MKGVGLVGLRLLGASIKMWTNHRAVKRKISPENDGDFDRKKLLKAGFV